MAPAKKPAVKTAAKPTSTAMIPFEEEMAKYADEAVAVTGSSGGTFISLKGGIISIGGVPVPSNKMEAVVVAHIFENAYRPGEYDASNPTPPECYAFGDDKDTMAPHPDSSNPQGVPVDDNGNLEGNVRDKDGTILGSCAECWANKFNSAEKGKGKACKNQRRLALIAGDEESLKNIADEKLEFIRTPVMSSGVWDDYVKAAATNMRRPPFALVTEITTAPDPKSQFRLVFKVNRMIEDVETFNALRAKHDEALVKLPFPYQAMTEEPKAAAKTGGKFAGKGKGSPAAPAKRPTGRR